MTDEYISSFSNSDTLPSTTALIAFVSAAEYSSFARAARELGRTPSSISHAIRDLEQQLGTTLFERVGRSVTLTTSGAAFLDDIKVSLNKIQSATRKLQNRRDDNVIRISALPFFTSAVLLPNLSRFEQANPDYILNLETSSSYADIANGEADIGIRFGRNNSEDLFCKHLISIAGQPIASHEYLKNSSKIKRATDLSDHTLIHVRQNPEAWNSWASSLGLKGLSGQQNLIFDSVLGALDAVNSGFGIALGMAPLIQKYPGYGITFTSLLDPVTIPHVGYNFICRNGNASDQKIVRTLKWLTSALQSYQQS